MSAQAVPDRGEEPFVIEGDLTELHWELGTENLLAKIDKHYKTTSVVASVGGAVGDMFGQAASAASLAMYDGEDTQNFACVIGDSVVWGEFAGAEMLPEGSRVKAVVTRRGTALCALAILSPDRGLLWIKHPWGVAAEARANWKIALWVFAFSLLCWLVAYLLFGSRERLWDFMAYGGVGSAVVCGGIALWANSGMKALAGPSTEMFRMLGFAKPESINLNGYMYFHTHVHEIVQNSISGYRYKNVYCYQKAIEDGNLAIG